MNEHIERIEKLVDKVEDWSRLPAEPQVSVYMTTYNHEKYIRQAIDSVLMQQVNFPYEIVIGEDKSDDATRDIVLEYQRKHPDKIRLRLARENLYSQGLKPGSCGVLPACRGKYVAMLEGDDYWTDPMKLQKQVDFLEANAGCSLTFHDAAIINDNKGFTCFSRRFEHVYSKEIFTHEDVIVSGWFIPTASMVFRNCDIVRRPPRWVYDPQIFSGDYTLQLLLSTAGYIRYIPEQMATYRQHSNGITTITRGTLQQYRKRVHQFRIYAGYFDKRYRHHFERKLMSYARKAYEVSKSDRRILARVGCRIVVECYTVKLFTRRQWCRFRALLPAGSYFIKRQKDFTAHDG